MADTTTESGLPAGLYYISVAFGPPHINGRRLTDENGRIVISPPSVHPDPKQEWLVTPVNEIRDIVIIQRPIIAEPIGNHLSYEGAPEKPKEHERIVLNRVPTEWRRDIAPGFTSILRVNGSNLGISVALLLPPPPDPSLWLDDKDEILWVFQRVDAE